MDTIIIQDFAVSCHIGVTPQERSKPQPLLLTVELGCDFATSAATDNLAHTIDYAVVCEHLAAFGEGRDWNLIEKLAVELAESILRKFKPRSVVVEVKKLVLPQARFVGVRVQRPNTPPVGRGS